MHECHDCGICSDIEIRKQLCLGTFPQNLAERQRSCTHSPDLLRGQKKGVSGEITLGVIIHTRPRPHEAGLGYQTTTVVWVSLKLKADGQSESRSVQNLLEVPPSWLSFVRGQCVHQLRLVDLGVFFRYLSREVAAYEEIVTD